MKLIPTAVSQVLGRQLLHAQKNSPAIMLGAGVTLGVVAAVKACQATLKLEEIMAHAEDEMNNARHIAEIKADKYPVSSLNHDLRIMRFRLARNVGKLYAPSVTLGVVSIGLLTGSHVVLTRRNAGLAAAYAVLDKGFNEYRDRVRSEFGDEKDQELRYGTKLKEIVEDGEHGHEVKTVKRNSVTGKSIYARYFDETNRNHQRDPRHNRTFIQCQQDWANDKLRARGHLFLNEVYDMLGMERSPEGAIVGWVWNHHAERDGYVDFGLDGASPEMRAFMNGDEGSVLLDFNVDGPVWNLI